MVFSKELDRTKEVTGKLLKNDTKTMYKTHIKRILDFMENSIKIFEEKKVRVHWEETEEKWYFSVVDVVEILTDSVNPRDYWFKMKQRVSLEDGIELSTICRQLKLISSDGKRYNTDCADVQALFRIIQAIPSPKAEPFKQWLAKVG